MGRKSRRTPSPLVASLLPRSVSRLRYDARQLQRDAPLGSASERCLIVRYAPRKNESPVRRLGNARIRLYTSVLRIVVACRITHHDIAVTRCERFVAIESSTSQSIVSSSRSSSRFSSSLIARGFGRYESPGGTGKNAPETREKEREK